MAALALKSHHGLALIRKSHQGSSRGERDALKSEGIRRSRTLVRIAGKASNYYYSLKIGKRHYDHN